MIITQITAIPGTEGSYQTVFGLGADNKIYYWEKGQWLQYDPNTTDVHVITKPSPPALLEDRKDM